MGSKESIQVVPIPGGSNKNSPTLFSLVLAWLIKDADPGPYIEGESKMFGVLVSGLILAVVIARIRRIIGMMNEEIINFLSLMKFKLLLSNNA